MIGDEQDERKNPVSDAEATSTTPETPLLAEVSAEDAPAVEEFMGQAAAQNEAAAGEMPETKQHKPGPYISFDKVSKSFGSLVVLNNVSFCVNPGETLCILGRSGVGKSVSLQMLMGFRQSDGCGRRYYAV